MALLGAAFLGASPSRAADEPPPDAAMTAAKAEFEEAQTLYIRELYGDAAAKFLSAYDKKPFGAFLFNAAVAFEKATKYEQAIQFFEKYLERDPEARDSAGVKQRIEGLRAMLAPPSGGARKTAALLPKIETKGLVIIDSKPAGAVIYLDDKKNGIVGRTPWQGSLPPKPVKIMIESKGFKPEERAISPRTDKVYEVYIALSEEHFLGFIEVASNVAGADVFLDKREIGAIGKTPYTGHVKPGKHTIWVERQGYMVAKKEIEVQPGTALTHMIELEKVQNGWVSVVGKHSRGGKLIVDGKPACDTPCRHEIAPGAHKVEVAKEGFESYQAQLEVGRSAETEVNVGFSPKPSRSSAWTTGAMSAVFFGGGIYAALKGKGIKDALTKESDPSKAMGKFIDTNDSRAQRGKYYYIGADVLFGLGVVTAAISAFNFIKSGPDSIADVEQKAIGLAPVGDGYGGTVYARGRF